MPIASVNSKFLIKMLGKSRKCLDAPRLYKRTRYHYLVLFCILTCIAYWYLIEDYVPLPSHVRFIPRKYDDFPLVYPPNLRYPFGAKNRSLSYRTPSEIKSFETPAGHHLFRNVCIFRHRPTRTGGLTGPFEGHVHAVINKHKSATKHIAVFPVDTYRMDRNDSTSYWMIEPFNGTIATHWAYKTSLAVFPSYWRDRASIFMLLMRIFPQVHGLLRFGKTEAQGAVLSADVIAPDISRFPQENVEALKFLGFENILDFKSVGKDVPVCYSHAAFGVLENEFYITPETIDKAKQSFESNYKSYPICDKYHVLFLQRLGTRKILDLDFLVNMFRESGYDNVVVKSFEGLTFFEQLNIIHCTSVLIAVQGAGLAWYEFLPHNATVVELLMPSWPSRYKDRIAKMRPDMLCVNIQCIPETSWLIYQKYAFYWFWRPFPVITENVKRKFVLRSREAWPVEWSIWKDSDCWCSPQFFLDQLPNLDRIP